MIAQCGVVPRGQSPLAGPSKVASFQDAHRQVHSVCLGPALCFTKPTTSGYQGRKGIGQTQAIAASATSQVLDVNCTRFQKVGLSSDRVPKIRKISQNTVVYHHVPKQIP